MSRFFALVVAICLYSLMMHFVNEDRARQAAEMAAQTQSIIDDERAQDQKIQQQLREFDQENRKFQ